MSESNQDYYFMVALYDSSTILDFNRKCNRARLFDENETLMSFEQSNGLSFDTLAIIPISNISYIISSRALKEEEEKE